ncbi:MAG: NUDIX domain-containing protein [Chitinivibrionales bacterium]|nr:NUDIX domain-containing protein [Chitinivibrionales bacterium]MBD3394979.1 NUDIX domain-containing protein [Chitinivibrionales bacterium]
MDEIDIAKEMEALAQTGLHFSENQFDHDRYARLRELAAELLASRSGLSRQEILEWRKAEFGYATPKVDVRAFILVEDQVLLVREDADAGRWTLPGGWADVNESPSESIIREVEEESGYTVEPKLLLAVFDRSKQGHIPSFPYHVYKMFFQCEIVGGAPRPTSESCESRLFSVDSLPELSESRVLPAQIRDFHASVQRGDTRTRYD